VHPTAGADPRFEFGWGVGQAPKTRIAIGAAGAEIMGGRR